eukprot:gi/632979847/ref/XP_007906701.1/ PREDICTED: Ig heavy chain Mem5-like [Callorhinchus milii]
MEPWASNLYNGCEVLKDQTLQEVVIPQPLRVQMENDWVTVRHGRKRGQAGQNAPNSVALANRYSILNIESVDSSREDSKNQLVEQEDIGNRSNAIVTGDTTVRGEAHKEPTNQLRIRKDIFFFVADLHQTLRNERVAWSSVRPPALSARCQWTVDPNCAPGEKITLDCAVRGVSLSKRYVSWFQQKGGSAPRFVVKGNATRGSGIPDRFSGLEDESTNVGRLIIQSVQADDAADYFCYTSTENDDARAFGGGTKLNVLDKPTSTPSVLLLPPASDQISTANAATLVCFVNNFYPDSVQVQWSVDGNVTETGVQTSPSLMGTDNTYSVSSCLTLSASEWTTHEVYSCGVRHHSLGSRLLEQTIQRSTCL